MINELNQIMKNAKEAFEILKNITNQEKRDLLYAMALEIESLGDDLLENASLESNLPKVRFQGERARTCMQLRMFGDLVKEGSWVEAIIDQADEERKPIRKPDMRKMVVPIGPIVVFGASNFPLAYSTAGGDTASAIAAGCPVVVKGHPSHPKTSQMVATALQNAVMKCNLPEGVFQHVASDSFEVGKILVQHPHTAAVGFTGSLSGGRALYDYACQREIPIPVFSEMGSVNPVILFKDALLHNAPETAKMLASSITMGVGQFCTNPGILIGVKSSALNHFTSLLALELSMTNTHKMLHEGIYTNYLGSLDKVLYDEGVETIFHAHESEQLKASPVLARVSGEHFMRNSDFRHEIFGPYSLIVVCDNLKQMEEIWSSFEGQLTTTIIGTEKDLIANQEMIKKATHFSGRIVYNGAPTGVEVGHATVHGGPYPATTDARFTSVGMDAIKRWVRPVCWQDCPEYLLPEELKDTNPMNIMRKVNGEYKK